MQGSWALALEGLVNVWLSKTINTNRFYCWYSNQWLRMILSNVQLKFRFVTRGKCQDFAGVTGPGVEDMQGLSRKYPAM